MALCLDDYSDAIRHSRSADPRDIGGRLCFLFADSDRVFFPSHALVGNINIVAAGCQIRTALTPNPMLNEPVLLKRRAF